MKATDVVSSLVMISIDHLSEEELIELNYKVVARLRFLRQARTHCQMMDFRIGERVCFRPAGRSQVSGTLTRYNKKSVTVITDAGEHWNVHPGLLEKMEAAREDPAAGAPSVLLFPATKGDGRKQRQ